MNIEKALTRLDKRMKVKAKYKRQAWELWGRDFTRWFIEIYKDYLYKTPRRKVIIKRQWSESFWLVSKSSHFWIPKLRESLKTQGVEIIFDSIESKWKFRSREPIEIDDLTIDIIVDRLKEVFDDIARTIESVDLSNIEPTTFATIVGILKYHLYYFLGHGDIWKYLSIIFNRKKDAIRKHLQRSKSRKSDYIREYKTEVLIYINQMFLPTICDEDTLLKINEEINQFIEWCENR